MPLQVAPNASNPVEELAALRAALEASLDRISKLEQQQEEQQLLKQDDKKQQKGVQPSQELLLPLRHSISATQNEDAPTGNANGSLAELQEEAQQQQPQQAEASSHFENVPPAGGKTVPAEATSLQSRAAKPRAAPLLRIRGFVARYATSSNQCGISIHTWAYTKLVDPELSIISVAIYLAASVWVVLIQIVVLIAIINESTKVKPCELQDDCSPGQFCMFQDIGLISENIMNIPIPTQPIDLNFKRRCWDCVYMFAGLVASSHPNMTDLLADPITSYSRYHAVYGKEQTEALFSLFKGGTDYCLELDRYPTQCDAMVRFQQTLTGANVLVLIVAAIILALPLIADFEQALSDASILLRMDQTMAKLPVRRTLISLCTMFINSLRMGVLPAMTTISTSALLLYTGASTQNILLNFAAISIVTTLDDQLVELFLHPTERKMVEEEAAKAINGSDNTLPWFAGRVLLLCVTLICMPLAIMNIEAVTKAVAKGVSVSTWNRNPGFGNDDQWTKGMLASGAVPCEAVYDALDFVGFLAGVLTLAAFCAYFALLHQHPPGTRLVTKFFIGFWVPCTLCFIMLSIGQQLVSKIAIGDMLQNLRPLYNNTKSMWASLDQIPPSRLSELMGNAFPYDVLRAYMTGP
jgi:hypothetical protein